MSNNKNYNNRQNRGNSQIDEVTKKISNLEMLKDMTPKIYADKDGYAEIIAKESRQLNTNQLRKFFAAIRLIEQKESWEEIEPEFYLLKPKFAVSVGRKLIPKDFYQLMMKTMEKVDKGTDEDKLKNFDTFVKFFEAIVAYHKFYER